MKIYDYLGIVNPKKGIWRYINLPVRASLICIIAGAAALILSRRANNGEAKEMLSFVMPFFTNNILAIAEMAFSVSSFSGDKKNTGFYKTIPNMREILKKSLIIDEIRRIADIVFTFFCFGIINYIGYGDFQLFAMAGYVITTYILTEFIILTVRRWNNVYITLLAFIFPLLFLMLLNILPVAADGALSVGPLVFIFLIVAVTLGIPANKYIIKQTVNCRGDLK